MNRSLSKTDTDAAARRVNDFLGTVSPAVQKRTDTIGPELQRSAASPGFKVGKLYALVEEITATIAPFVACSKGCSGCCKMNVGITDVEAKLISGVTGRTPVPITKTIEHAQGTFNGAACPFLVGDDCSIYDNRPLVCRTHHSFDATNYWCQPDRADSVALPMVGFGRLKSVSLTVQGKFKKAIFADIRDFFPVPGK